MTRQLNVRQQNALTTKDVLDAAALFRRADRRVAWLKAAFRSRDAGSESGLLVAFGTVPDQGGGDWVSGTWLTSGRRFWASEAVVPPRDGEQVDIEQLDDITDSVLVSAHVPGVGKSFGCLALEVLDLRQPAGRARE